MFAGTKKRVEIPRLVIAIISFLAVAWEVLSVLGQFRLHYFGVFFNNRDAVCSLISLFMECIAVITFGCFILSEKNGFAIVSCIMIIVGNATVFIFGGARIIAAFVIVGFVLLAVCFGKKRNGGIQQIPCVLPSFLCALIGLILELMVELKVGSEALFHVWWFVSPLTSYYFITCSSYVIMFVPFLAYAVYDYLSYKKLLKTIPEQLRGLIKQFESGEISSEEYASAKRKLLEKM